MARKGPLPEMNGGAAKTNPIHDGDLAQVCADAIEGKTGDIDAGGPEVLTRRQIGELAFAAAGKPPRFRQIPPWLIGAASKLMKPFHPRIADRTLLFLGSSRNFGIGGVLGLGILAKETWRRLVGPTDAGLCGCFECTGCNGSAPRARGTPLATSPDDDL